MSSKRFKELMVSPSPKDRSEIEILGYRKALSEIHANPSSFSIDEKIILNLHRSIYAYTGLLAGEWKKKDNSIEERLPDGSWITRFVHVSAKETPFYMQELCKAFNRLMNNELISPLILIPAFILDFLCIHPFQDGNGRISRLLTVLLLHQADYVVGRYISLERLIEESKETYYEALHLSSQNWHEGKHTLKPWWEYSLGILIHAYKEFENRLTAQS